MVAITMPKLASLVTKLQHDYPTLTFTLSNRFYYHVPDTIFYSTSTDASTNQSCLLLLHELGHYLINHNEYQSDVELIKIELLPGQRLKRSPQNTKFHGMTISSKTNSTPIAIGYTPILFVPTVN